MKYAFIHDPMKSLPAWENHKAGYQENRSKNNKQGIAGLPPSSVIEHLGRLQTNNYDETLVIYASDKLEEVKVIYVLHSVTIQEKTLRGIL